MAASQTTIAPIVERVVPTVVSIAVRGEVQEEVDPLLNDPFFRKFFGVPDESAPSRRGFQAAGSGVIVDASHGYILTNNHVVENATEITVTLAGGGAFHAKVVGADPETDIAVVQISAPNLKSIELGDSTQLHVGDYVAAVGNPFGLGQTVTLGIVSALGRAELGIEGYENFIQTDASINPGNSGGALVDMDGKLVGINSAIIGPSGGNVGIGFAIPVSMAKDVMDKLIRDGSIRRGLLGVAIQDLDADLAKALGVTAKTGAVISQVNDRSPAAQAGMKPGDVVVAVEGNAIKGAADLRNLVGMHAPGDRLRVTFLRAKNELQAEIVLAEQPRPEAAQTKKITLQGEGYLASVVLGNLDESNDEQGMLNGAIILDLDDDSRAAAAGLQAGDVIVGVAQNPVRSPEEVMRAARQSRDVLLLSIYRDGQTRFVVVGS
ncbi:Do family serine endopeptidase [Agrobacterium vitis]|uniref:Do family serine endopeptidase n=1 Tax=Agrobacterium vitis TaxID=373 RepID=UPI003D2D7B35